MATALSPRVAAELEQALTAVCGQIDLNPADAILIKYTMNAVYKIGDYVLRLNHGEHAHARARIATRAAAALTARAVPVIEPATTIADQPIYADDWVATIWKFVPTVDDIALPVDLAAPLRCFHAIADLDVDLPTWDLIGKFRRRIGNAAAQTGKTAAEVDQWSQAELALPATALIDTLYQWCDELETRLDALVWHLPAGPIHGDAHTGNLLLRRHPARPHPDPTALICDPDGISNGPREWDLVPTAHGTTRFGRPRADYDAFATAYGFDLLTWPGWPTISRLREVQVVTSVIDTFTGRPRLADQLALRLRSMIADDPKAIWTRFA